MAIIILLVDLILQMFGEEILLLFVIGQKPRGKTPLLKSISDMLTLHL